MSLPHRIRTVYGKELLDILRDRRTLIAMVVVPIVLYPLLMVGSIQAVSFQANVLGQEKIRIGTLSETQQRYFAILAAEDDRIISDMRREAERKGIDPDTLPTSMTDTELALVETRDHLIASIQDRIVHVAVVFDSDPTIINEEQTIQVEVLADLEEVRSRAAYHRIMDMFDRVSTHRTRYALDIRELPQTIIKPFDYSVVDLAAPPSVLGQVLPLILILMTITGAIYPAIDLTAGERERGTLESLMVCPVPVIDLIVGKFLVVTTVAIMGAALNLASVSATVYFGGFGDMLASTGGGIPVYTMVMILLCLIPFAVLMSAIMIAVCSFARTFKEAQNYVTPVILAVLIPGGIAAMPTAKAEGIMLVMPVGNMVILARDFLLGTQVPFSQIALAVLSTTLYAGAAVAIAAAIFGRETVVFSDSGSLNTALKRKYFKPLPIPPISMPLMYVALLFPVWYFIQTALGQNDPSGQSSLFKGVGILMPVFFALLPIGILLYWKIDVGKSLCLQLPPLRFQLAALLIGVSAWVPAAEFNIFQKMIFSLPDEITEQAQRMAEALQSMDRSQVLLFTAVIPAVCEELLFRGFLLSGFRDSSRRWIAIVASGVIFGVFHFFLFKIPVTAGLGIVLAYLCWQSRSIVPAIMAHMIHNGLVTMIPLNQDSEILRWAIGDPESANEHLPMRTILIGGAVFVTGILLCVKPVATENENKSMAAPSP